MNIKLVARMAWRDVRSGDGAIADSVVGGCGHRYVY